MIKEGGAAPSFTLKDSNDKKVSLRDFKGKNVVVYFYPADALSGASTCIKEACEFRDAHPSFKKVNAVVLGISPDSVKSHKKFAEKFDLPFTILSDENKKAISKYGVWKEKLMFGKKIMGVERSTFIIDKQGKIAKIFNKVRVKGHVQAVIETLSKL